MQAQTHNPDSAQDAPREELDVAYSIVRPSEYIDLLKQVNFGTGYYEERELNLQMRNIRRGIFADVAFSPTLRKHAVQETKIKLADHGFRYYDESMSTTRIWEPIGDSGPDIEDDERDVSIRKPSGDIEDILDQHGRTRALRKRGEEIWLDLADPAYSLSVQQAAALDEKASASQFKPLFYKLAAAYHELTKSKGARLVDNYFGRAKEHHFEGDTEQAGSVLNSRAGQ